MPCARPARARWVAVAPKEPEATKEARPSDGEDDCASQADWRLLQLRGGWRDSKGSTYRLELSEDGASMDVHTRRPTGEVISTSNLIRVERRKEVPAGRVVWGRQGARAQYTLGAHCKETLRWEHKGRPPFEWHRDGAADGESSELGEVTVECAPTNARERCDAGAAQSVAADAAQAPEDAFTTLRALLGLPASPLPRAEGEEAGRRSAEAERPAEEEPCPPPEQPAEDGRQAGLRLLRSLQGGDPALPPPPSAPTSPLGGADGAADAAGVAVGHRRPSAAFGGPGSGAEGAGACAVAGGASSSMPASEASPVVVDGGAAAASEADGAASAAVAEDASPARAAPADAAGRDSEPELADEFRVVGSAGSTTAGGSAGSTPKWPPPDLEHLEPEKLEKAAQLLFGALSSTAASPSSSSALPRPPADGQRAPPPPLTRSGSSSNSGEELGSVETIWQPLPERWPALPAFPLVVHWHPNDPVNQMLLEQVSRILGFHLALSDLQEGSYFRSQMSSGGWVKLHVFQALYHVRALGANLRALQRAVAGNSTLELDASGLFVRLAGRRGGEEDEPAPWQ